ncbi:TetR/AcrR family transcriptional regulator [Saccharopolyspora gloriosae]|uniref:TetR/AcrR family transcriptional regulator n=1 Tax=Saccharopolyspora gloriosae TaxID=455344 RepID=UPI001FB65622|nr:TetR/AcrR family transcriptional regulator [Saccharopolyspora gloriosae]
MNQSNQQSRRRIVAGAADMIRRRGLNATSVRELAKHAQAPLGSTYHYFPGGKRQLAAEAVRFAGDDAARTLRAELQSGPADGLRAFLDLWRNLLTATDHRAGCPVLAVAVEETDEDAAEPLAAAAEVFAHWESLLAESLRAHGASGQQAEQIATLVVASVEGAVVLCRAQRSTRPLDRVAAQLDTVVTTATSA